MPMDNYVKSLTSEIKAHGVTEYQVLLGGKHRKLVFTWNGKETTCVFPASPSDSSNGVLNALEGLRRIMGVKRIIRPKSTKPKKNKIRAPSYNFCMN